MGFAKIIIGVCFFALIKLCRLYIDDNNAVTNPNLGLLPRLSMLYLGDNRVITGDTLLSMPSLTYVNLHENTVITSETKRKLFKRGVNLDYDEIELPAF